MAEVCELGRECALVYGLLWESAFKDVSGKKARKPLRDFRRKGVHHWAEGLDERQGGTTNWSNKGLADRAGIGKTTVIKALKKLLDAGFIQYAGWSWGNGFRKRRWRVTHPADIEAVRYAISVMGPPSLKYNNTHDQTETHQAETWEADLDGNVWPENCGERCDDEAWGGTGESVSDRDGEGGCVVVPGEV